MTPLVGACERTSDVALTFRWLLALGLRLLGQLLFQLPALLSLQHWVLILGLPVDMTGSLQSRRDEITGDKTHPKKKKRKRKYQQDIKGKTTGR